MQPNYQLFFIKARLLQAAAGGTTIGAVPPSKPLAMQVVFNIVYHRFIAGWLQKSSGHFVLPTFPIALQPLYLFLFISF
jgi:hypothetical protein